MTEHQQRNSTATVSTFMITLRAEIERLAVVCHLDPGSREPTSSTQWKAVGKLNCANKDIVENDACSQSTQFTPWLTWFVAP